jgi:hypothetical protein
MAKNKKGECRNTGKSHFKKGCIPWNKDKNNLNTIKECAQ